MAVPSLDSGSDGSSGKDQNNENIIPDGWMRLPNSTAIGARSNQEAANYLLSAPNPETQSLTATVVPCMARSGLEPHHWCSNVDSGWGKEDPKQPEDKFQTISQLNDVQKDLSDSLTSNNSSNPSSRQSRSAKMKAKRSAFIEARKSRTCKRQPPIEVKMMNSKEVDNNVVQDVSIPLVIIGTDVVSLYPNLKWDPAGEQVYQAIMETDIKFEGINYKEGVRYLALVRGFDWCKASSLRRVLPERRFAKGGWPGITGAGPLGPGVNDEDQWDFPIVELTDKEKKMIIGEIMRMSVEVLFKTHCYSFKGSNFRQSDGGPIGLRATCAIARVVMARHSIMWAKLIEANNINTSFIGFYVDDGRIIMYSLRPGWRWFNGGLWYREDWEQEEKFLSPTERTKNMISRTLGDIVDCLEFTVETPEDYPDNWLPTLDISMHMNSENQLQYRFFEKPTASKVCLQADTALSQNCLVQSLVQDIIRRMLNCSSHTDIETRCQIIDKFAQKMFNSGHQ